MNDTANKTDKNNVRDENENILVYIKTMVLGLSKYILTALEFCKALFLTNTAIAN
ncbi:MAG: hypothetical protein GX166_12435 [Clostridiaceae bacterium]|nr:hypothetical protein [Clostridiaceae bacterium]